MTRDRRIRWLLPTAYAAALLAGLLAPPAQSRAGWRDDMKSFRIGLIAEDGGGQARAGSAGAEAGLCAGARHSGRDLRRARLRRPHRRAGDRARRLCRSIRRPPMRPRRCYARCVEPVAAPVGEDGATGIKAILVTRDGRLSKLADISDAPGRHGRPRQYCGLRPAAARACRRAGALTGEEPFLVHADSASQPRRCSSTDRSMRFSAGCRPMPSDAELAGGTLRTAGGCRASTGLRCRWSGNRRCCDTARMRCASGLDAELRLTSWSIS